MLEGHGTSYGGERGKEKEDPVGIWKRLLLLPSRFTLASRTNDTRRDVRLENFHLLLSSPPRWQECVGPRRGNLCLISISDIENSLDESQFRELPRFRANKKPNNKREERVTETRSFCHERYIISSDVILHAIYFTRCWVVPPRKDFISVFHCSYVEQHSNGVNFFLGKEAVRKFGRSIHQCF